MTSLAPRCAFRTSTRQPGPPRPPGRRRRVEKWSGGSRATRFLSTRLCGVSATATLCRSRSDRPPYGGVASTSGDACVRGRVREGTNRQESTGIDRSRVCPCGARHETATAQGLDRVGSGAARRDEVGWRGCFDIHEPLRKGVRPRVGALRRALDRSFAGGLWRAVASRAAV